MSLPQPGHATLAAEIGLAESRKVALVGEIGRRPCAMFLAMTFTGGAGS